MSRCGYCHDWNAGHNRIGCPKRKEDVRVMREKYDAGEYSYYPSLLTEDDRYKSKKARKCSYCMNRHYEWEYGHDRRNCPRLKADRERVQSENVEWRAEALSLLKRRGIGPGAIIRTQRNGIGVISEVRWDSMTSLMKRGHNVGNCFFVTYFKSPDRQHGFNFLKDESLNRIYWGWDGPEEVLVPATEGIIDANLPDGWVEGKTGLDFYFATDYDKHC